MKKGPKMRHPLPKRRLIFSSVLTAVVMKKGLEMRHPLPKRRLTFSSVLTAVVMKKVLRMQEKYSAETSAEF
jgi:hypothetical protein